MSKGFEIIVIMLFLGYYVERFVGGWGKVEIGFYFEWFFLCWKWNEFYFDLGIN